jgi:hypothetical protein
MPQQRPAATPGTREIPPPQRRERPSTGQIGAGQGQGQGYMGERQENREEYRTEAREDWQKHANEAREERQDWAEDQNWDYHHHDEFAAGVVVGATRAVAVRPTYVGALPCSATTVIANGTTYYRCAGTWYYRGYESGSVVYIVTTAPPGF